MLERLTDCRGLLNDLLFTLTCLPGAVTHSRRQASHHHKDELGAYSRKEQTSA